MLQVVDHVIFFLPMFSEGTRKHVRLRRKRDTSESRQNNASEEESDLEDLQERPGCIHYERRCKLVCPACNLDFPCRFCHDEIFEPRAGSSEQIVYNGNKYPTHKIDRTAVSEIICSDCDQRQAVSANCVKCNVTFGTYFCSQCNFFDNNISKKIWHCDQCGICRVGGKENYFHCENCDGCYPLTLQGNHKCLPKAMRRDCPICLEPLFESTKPVHVLENCGHTLHSGCFESHRRSCYATWNKCPLCLVVHTTPLASPRRDEWHTVEEIEEAAAESL
eukprot:Gregarina_sp_Poly_1__951@NODE_122_length_13497_cov_184_110052_g109_i0_p3_GENE_NODE_122_length_13497_cov_184_110052_g109_i0NODE_122_length_13497_cov_184_110052_g109_i0_p3_ORF_typecomplete_len277_score26_12zfCHY/PF05495_12/3e19zfCHY/PF05495_12/1_8e04zfRING_UBOX/PF13445_6/3_3e03zfRING_UBOX/PF13445_6/9e03zfRING_UBOX/PF13445_6/1_3e04zfRING_UBOX/PF13445_6/3_1e07zfRING_UBOX/PF13445_6/4_9e02zfC3HC4/PF00097_25/7e03zfC3HC4/PF00097_25/1_8e04zfC3HC4/PF00097_25/3_2e06ProkRING_4/PF14447_6/1_5e04ProkRING_4/PF1